MYTKAPILLRTHTHTHNAGTCTCGVELLDLHSSEGLVLETGEGVVNESLVGLVAVVAAV